MYKTDTVYVIMESFLINKLYFITSHGIYKQEVKESFIDNYI